MHVGMLIDVPVVLAEYYSSFTVPADAAPAPGICGRTAVRQAFEGMPMSSNVEPAEALASPSDAYPQATAEKPAHAPGTAPVECPRCRQAFTCEEGLTSHLRRLHGIEAEP